AHESVILSAASAPMRLFPGAAYAGCVLWVLRSRIVSAAIAMKSTITDAKSFTRDLISSAGQRISKRREFIGSGTACQAKTSGPAERYARIVHFREFCGSKVIPLTGLV